MTIGLGLLLAACKQDSFLDKPRDDFPGYTENPDDTGFVDTGETEEICETGLVYETEEGESLCIVFEHDQFDVDEFIGSSVLFDMNGDGDKDLYVATPGSQNDFILLNQSGLWSKVDDTSGTELFGDSRSLLKVDLDGDGDEDLIRARADSVDVLQNTGGESLLFDQTSLDVSLARTLLLNQDDLFVGTTNGLKVFQQTTDWEFGENLASDLNVFDAGEANALVSADFNDDGFSDVFVSNIIGANRVFAGQKDGRYEFIEEELGLAGKGFDASVGAMVFDLNGSQSILVGYEDTSDELFVKNDEGKYEDQAAKFELSNDGSSCLFAQQQLVEEGPQVIAVAGCHETDSLLVEHPVLNGFGNIESYENVAEALGFDKEGVVGIHRLDFDQDGREDWLLVTMTNGIHLFYDRSYTGNFKYFP